MAVSVIRHLLIDLNQLLSENPYFTGVSIVHNNNNELTDIWTYLSALAEVYYNSIDYNFPCPCVQIEPYLNIYISLCSTCNIVTFKNHFREYVIICYWF